MRSKADFDSLHRYSSNNRELLSKSDLAGCFYCGSIFSPREIQDWVDGKQVESGDLEDGVTALCPRCGIDSVLPATAAITLTEELLTEMHDHWF
jgi:hypothetical protein